MKKHLLVILGLGLLVGTVRADDANAVPTAGAKPGLKDDKARMSYAIGMSTANSLKQNDLQADPDVLAQGLKDALAGGPTLMTDQEMKEEIKKIQTEIRAKFMEKQKQAEEKRKQEAVKNKAAGRSLFGRQCKKRRGDHLDERPAI